MPKGDARRLSAERWWAGNGYDLRRLIEEEQVTQEEAARQLHTTRSIVQGCCKRYGLQTQSTGPRRGEKHTGWKGGRRKVCGYWYCYRPNHPHATKQGYVLEHRLVVEETEHRLLAPTDVVHHRDANRENNKYENLVVFQTNAAHLHHELQGRTPNWSPAGRQRVVQVCRTNAANRKK